MIQPRTHIKNGYPYQSSTRRKSQDIATSPLKAFAGADIRPSRSPDLFGSGPTAPGYLSSHYSHAESLRAAKSNSGLALSAGSRAAHITWTSLICRPVTIPSRYESSRSRPRSRGNNLTVLLRAATALELASPAYSPARDPNALDNLDPSA